MLAFSKCCHAQKRGAKVERHSAEAVALQTMAALGHARPFRQCRRGAPVDIYVEGVCLNRIGTV
jgi:hypothetical protein